MTRCAALTGRVSPHASPAPHSSPTHPHSRPFVSLGRKWGSGGAPPPAHSAGPTGATTPTSLPQCSEGALRLVLGLLVILCAHTLHSWRGSRAWAKPRSALPPPHESEVSGGGASASSGSFLSLGRPTVTDEVNLQS